MAAVSYTIVAGQTLEQVTTGANAPAGGNGSIELRMDQTAGVITDANAPGGVNTLKKSEIQRMIRTLEEYLMRDTNIYE